MTPGGDTATLPFRSLQPRFAISYCPSDERCQARRRIERLAYNP